MRRSDAEDLSRIWAAGEGKVFKYCRPLVPDEYLVFYRDNTTYKCEKTVSTYKLNDMNREEFMKLLMNEELVYVRDYTYNLNVRNLKTGGCTCGCWIVKDNTWMHDDKCPLYRGVR